jgi:phosphopantetheinyl transferase
MSRVEPAYQHRDYLKRISSASERHWVMSSAHPDEALWRLWAAKEATYKALSPVDGTAAFRPAEIAVRWRSRGPANSAEAQWGTGRTRVAAGSNGQCAYAVAVRTDREPHVVEHAIFPLCEVMDQPHGREVTPAAHSAAARALTGYLLKRIGIASAEIARGESGRPYVVRRPDVFVSWSHDGDWVAAMVAVQGGIR